MATLFLDRKTALTVVVNDADADAMQKKLAQAYPDGYFERIVVGSGESFRIEAQVEQRLSVRGAWYPAR